MLLILAEINEKRWQLPRLLALLQVRSASVTLLDARVLTLLDKAMEIIVVDVLVLDFKVLGAADILLFELSN